MAKLSRKKKIVGDSMLVPPEREEYQLGNLVKKGIRALSQNSELAIREADKKAYKAEIVAQNKLRREKGQVITGKSFKLGEPLSDEQLYRKEIPAGSTKFKQIFAKNWADSNSSFEFEGNTYSTSITDPTPEVGFTPPSLKDKKAKGGSMSMMSDPKTKMYAEGGETGGLLSETSAYIAATKALADPETPKGKRVQHQLTLESLKPEQEGGTVNNDTYAIMMQQVDAEAAKKAPVKKAEGGSMLVPPEMAGMEAPVDTYPNIPPEEMAAVEASQLPDEAVEDNYVDFVMNEALEQEEQSYLMTALEADPQLSMIFDKVVDTASEFSGAGPVDGPGDGVSDSIPARLSAGEFVVTKKATDQIGADQLQTMMDEAERAYDGGLMGKDRAKEKDDDINESMLSSNQMPSLNIRKR